MQRHDASRFLQRVREGEEFILADGRSIASLKELAMLLETIQHDVFKHHVNDVKNDFAAWIEQSIGDHELAERVRHVTDYATFKSLIQERIGELETMLLADSFLHETGQEHETLPQREAERIVKKAEETIEEELEALERLITQETPEHTSHTSRADEHSLMTPQNQPPVQHSPPPQPPAQTRREPSRAEQDILLEPRSEPCEQGFYWTDFLIGLAAGILIGVLTAFLYTLLTTGGP